MIFNMVGGGITALNFNVIGSTVQPSNPTENTIWVNTDAPITNWAFSATQPTSPSDNMVWIQTHTTSIIGFNALNNNMLMTYPIVTKQYISSEWVDKDFQIYQNGTWAEAVTYLFKSGDLCSAITGGWVTGEGVNINPFSSEIHLKYSNKQDYGASVSASTVNMIDVTNYTTLFVVLDSNNESFTLSLIDSSGKTIASASTESSESVRNIMIDLTNITGNYYIKLYAYAHDHGTEGDSYVNVHFTVSEVKLK